VPIIIHLIHKRKPAPQAFAAIELLLRSVERVEKRWRLRRLLLLLSRVALLAALALAAAGPLLGREADRATSSAGPERLAIVLDGSLSMRARFGGTASFARALTAARNLVDRMGPEDQAIILLAGRPNRLLVDRPTPDRGRLLRLLDDLEPGYGTAELGEAVSAAVSALGSPKEAAAPEDGEAPAVAARVVLLSDLAQHGFQTAAALDVPGTRSKARVEVVDVLEEAAPARANHALARTEAVNVPGEAPRTVELRSRVQSFSAEGGGAQALDITLRSQERDLEVGSVDVVPGTIVDKALRHAFERPGHIPVTVALEPDALAEDDVRHVMVEVRRQVRTLIVDGAPSGVPKEDEVFYLERALLAGAADQPPPRVITADDLSRTDLAGFDVVILAGVATFTRADGARLAEHVERGGGLMISAAEGLDVDLYNAELGAVLPRPLRGLKIVDAARGGVGSEGEVGLAEPDLEHPVMEIFRGDGLGGLLSTKTQGYLLLQPGGGKPMTVLASHTDGQPALIAATAGQGRVIVLSTSVDRDLSDLPIRPAFVPMMRQIVLYLGDALAAPDLRDTLVGQPRELHIPAGAQEVTVIGPDGSERRFGAEELEAGKLAFTQTDLPGQYRVEAVFAGPPEPLRGEDFPVNVDPAESDLRPLSVAEAQAILLGTTPDADPEVAASAVRSKLLGGGLSPEALVGALLALMVLSFLLESALTTSRPTKASSPGRPG
jgi:hypothetical protein